MNFSSYMDETGIQTADPYCSIGGYAAPVQEWEAFDHDWRFVLNEYMRGIPQLERHFHALEFYGYHKKYRTWSAAKRESFVNALFNTISGFDLTLFCSSIDVQMFLSLTRDERTWLTGGQHNGLKWKRNGAPSKPYFLPFQHCMIQSANLVSDGDKAFPIMSRQDQYKMKALELYELMLNTDPAMQCRNRLADDVVFLDPKTTPALQAADLAVYWFGQFTAWRARTGQRRSDGFPERVQLMKLFRNVRGLDDLKMFDFEGLMLVLTGCNRYIRTSFVTLDQLQPSLPLKKRLEFLGAMRKVNFRQFLDRWQPSVPEVPD
jgi:Protein of unknown function (DUF3800)